jgi:hypothetical protein
VKLPAPLGLLIALAFGCGQGAGTATDAAAPSIDAGVAADLAGPMDAAAEAGPGPDGAAAVCPGGVPRFAVSLDSRDCTDRIPASCPDGPSDAWKLGSVVRQLLGQCGGGSEIWLRVSFEMGCPTGFQLGGPSAGQMGADCLAQAFAHQRWQCALALDCGYAERSTLP